MLSFIFSVLFLDLAFASKHQLALNWKPEPEFGGFYEAKLNGLYQKAGLDIEILPGGAGQPVAQMLAAKKVDFGIVSGDEIVLARSKGAKIKAVFAVYQVDPHGFMVRPERGIQHIQDLFQSSGTIALEKGSPYAEWLLKKYAPIKAKIVPYSGGVAEFIRNKDFSQQCFVFSEPIAARRLGQPAQVLMVAESGFNPYMAVVAVHEDLLKKDLKKVQNFVRATRAGWINYINKPEKTNSEMQKLNNSMDLETFAAASVAHRSLIETEWTRKNKIGEMDSSRWDQLSQQMKQIGLIEKVQNSAEIYQNL